MALSISELELQATEYLPAREVMSTAGGFNNHHTATYGPAGNLYNGGILNGVNVQDVASDLNLDEVQVSLVNVVIEDIDDLADVATANFSA